MRSVRGQRKAVLTAVGMAIGSMGALFAPSGLAATNYYWDPTGTASTAGTGSANWDTSDPFWFNGTSDVAWDNGQDLNANFGNAALTPATVTLTNDITADAVNFNSTGYTIAGTNTLSFTSMNLAGGAGIAITSPLNVGSGATINFAGLGVGDTTTKLSLNAGNMISGAGPINVTGTSVGGILTINSATGYTGAWNVGGAGGAATIEDTVATATGTGLGTGTVTLNSGGELSIKNTTVPVANPITLAGGVLGSDSAAGGTASGPVTVSANSSIRLGQFYGGTSDFFTISGALSGSGNLNLLNGVGQGVLPGAQFLKLSGNNSGYTGIISVHGGQTLEMDNAGAIPLGSGGTPGISVSSNTMAVPVIDFGYNTLPSVAPFSYAPGTIGVIAYGLGTGGLGSALGSTKLDMNTLPPGWFLGGGPGASVFASPIVAANVDSTHAVFRLGGGGQPVLGYMFVGSATLASTAGTTTSTIIGNPVIGGNGIVKFGQPTTYNGTTTITSGSQLNITYASGSTTAVNRLPHTTQVILQGGALTVTTLANKVDTQTLDNGILVDVGAGAIGDSVTAGTGSMLLTANAITRNTGGTLDFTVALDAVTNQITTTTTNANFSGGQQTILGGYATYLENTWAVSGATASAAGNISGLATYSPTFAAGTDVDAPISTSTPGSLTVNSLRFNNAGAYTISDSGSGDTLNIATGGILETAAVGANAVEISTANLTSGNGQDLIVIQNNLATNPAMIIDTLLTGTNGLTKSGPGGLTLTAANTYSGNTNLNAGTLTLGNSLALQNSTVNFNVFAGKLSFGSLSAATIGGLNGNQQVVLTSSTGPVALTVGGNNASTTFGGSFTGSGSVTKIGTGTLTIGSPYNDYPGPTTVNGGGLIVNGALTGAGAVTLAAGTTLGGTGSIAGAVTVPGGSSAATQGNINLQDGVIGTLSLQNGLNISGSSAGEVTNLSFDFNPGASDSIAINGAFNVGAGGATINIHSLLAGGFTSSTYTLISFTSGTGAGFATGSGSTVGALTLSTPVLAFGVLGSLNVTNTAVQAVTTVLPAPATAYFSGVQGTHLSDTSSDLTKGNFTTDQPGSNFIAAYPASTTDVIFSNAPAIAGATPFTLTLGLDFDLKSLTFANGNPATTIGGTNTLTLEGGGITVQSGAGAVVINPTSLVLNQSQTWTNSSANPLTVGSKVSGPGGLTTVGDVIMTGVNNYAGNTTVSSGTLQLGTGSLTSAGNLTVNGTLDVNGSNVNIANLNGTGTLTNGAAAAANATLTTNLASNSTFSGPITDNGTGKSLSLVVNGSNSLTLSGANNYSGNTTINGPTVVLGSATALGNGAGNLAVNSGTLDIHGLGSATGGPQTLHVGSLSSLSGTITDNGTIAGTSTVAFNQSSVSAIGGTVLNGPSRSVALSESGTGTASLSNPANNYSGGTTISGGKLVAVGSPSISSGPVTLSGGTLSLAGYSTMSGFGGNSDPTSLGNSTISVHQTGTFGGALAVNDSTPTAAVTSDVLTLTDNNLNQGRDAFFTKPQTISDGAGFVANFTYTPSGDEKADGMVFVIENDPHGSNIDFKANPGGITTPQGQLGYSGITKSGGLILNLFSGSLPNGASQTGFVTNGTSEASPNDLNSTANGNGGINLHEGVPNGNYSFPVTLTYQNGSLTELISDGFVTDTFVYPNVDFESLLGGTTGYVGFTGSTGGSGATQQISNFTFQNFVNGNVSTANTFSNPITAAAGTTSGIEVGYANPIVGTVTVQAGATVNVTSNAAMLPGAPYTLTTGTLSVAAGGTFKVAPTTLTTPSGQRTLLITPTVNANSGQIDLSNNDMIDSTTSEAAAVVNQLKSGFNAGAGYWNGNGIVSSSAATDARFLTTLGYRTADGTTAFDGQTPAAGTLEVKYTYYGDANLDGTVNGADYQQIDMGFGTGASTWSSGDFNYDGVVNGSDFALIDNTFNQLTATGAAPLALVASPAAIGVSPSAVPEPTTLGLLGIGAIGLLGRRRRRTV